MENLKYTVLNKPIKFWNRLFSSVLEHVDMQELQSRCVADRVFNDLNLSFMKYTDNYWDCCRFNNADMHGCEFVKSLIKETGFNNVIMTVLMKNSAALVVAFNKCIFTKFTQNVVTSSFRAHSTKFEIVEFNKCNMEGAMFCNCYFYDCKFNDCQIDPTNFIDCHFFERDDGKAIGTLCAVKEECQKMVWKEVSILSMIKD